jgi:hypothetical protein
MIAIDQELLEQIKKLDMAQKKQVLDFVRHLTRPKGELGKDFIERTSHIDFPKEDLEEIKRHVEEYEERIDWDDWNNPPTLSD